VGHKKRKVWLWLAVERARRRIVGWTLGWTLGCRGEAPLRQLWQALPQRYHRHCWSFTDPWKAYAKVLPRWQHRPCAKGAGQTNIVEAINCLIAPALRRAGAQVLFLQQIIGHAYRPN